MKDQGKDILSFWYFVVVFAQGQYSKMQQSKDLCNVIDLAISVYSCCSSSHFSEFLHNKFVSVDNTKYGEMETTTGEDERWATAFFNFFFELRDIVRRDLKYVINMNLQNEKLLKRVCCLS